MDVLSRNSPPVISLGQSLSPEIERDYYKEKIEHFKLLVKKLQDEVQCHKIRKEGAETVSKLLQESKQQVVSLKRKIETYEAVIRNMQSRLEANGLSSDIVLQEGETYIPGNSKTVLDNLARENNRLRTIIRNNVGDPEEVARWIQRCEEAQAECTETKIMNSTLQKRTEELEQVFRTSDNEKDKTINHLHEELTRVHHELRARDTQFTTLAEESQKLHQQLVNVARQCEELALKLQEQSCGTDKAVEKTLKADSPDVQTNQPNIMAENIALKQRVKEITEMNQRWQDYNNQRESYVKKLLLDMSELKEREKATKQNVMAYEAEVEMNRLLDEIRHTELELKKKNEEDKRLNVQIVNERNKARRELENANAQLTTLRNENQHLKNVAKAGGNQAMSEPTETINALKAQIQICTEDFEHERRDRERAQSKVARLESELDQTIKENETLKRERHVWQNSQTQYIDPFYHYQTPISHGQFSTEALATRGVVRERGQNIVDARDTSTADNMDQFANERLADKFKRASAVVERDNPARDNYVSLNTSSISSISNERESPSPRISPVVSSHGSPVTNTSHRQQTDNHES